MSKHLTFILGFVLAAAVTSAAVVTYGIKSNGVTLPARPVLSFSGATTCVDDPANNATSCVTDAGSGGSSGPTFWYDAGAGYIFAAEAIQNPDAGMALRFDGKTYAASTNANPLQNGYGSLSAVGYEGSAGIGFANVSSFSAVRGTAFAANNNDGTYAFGIVNNDTTYGSPGLLIQNKATNGAPSGIAFTNGNGYHGSIRATGTTTFGYVNGISVSVPSGKSFGIRNDTSGGIFVEVPTSTGEIISYVSSGTDALRMSTGARVNLGAGASDYAVSDGTGIETPSYWESTRTLTTGPGLIASATTLTSNSTLSFDSTLSSTYAAGSIATDDIRGTVIRRLASTGTSAFAPVAPHIVFDEQTFTTRIIGKEWNAPPKFAEFVAQSAPTNKYLDMYWTDADNFTQVLDAGSNFFRLWYYIETTAAPNNQQYGTSTASTQGTFDGTAFTRMTSSDLSPSMCQRVYTGADMTNTRIWVGLGAGELAAGTSTMSQNGVFFRYDSSVPDTAWQFCTKDGTTQSCGNTTVTVTAATEYTLCAKLDETRTAYAYINGNIVGRKTSNRVPNDTPLGPFISVETLTTATKRLNVGVMQIGTR